MTIRSLQDENLWSTELTPNVNYASGVITMASNHISPKTSCRIAIIAAVIFTEFAAVGAFFGQYLGTRLGVPVCHIIQEENSACLAFCTFFGAFLGGISTLALIWSPLHMVYTTMQNKLISDEKHIHP